MLDITRLGQLYDVTITSPSNGQVLTYNTATGKWINAAGADLSGYVPYTGATADVNLGTHTIVASSVATDTIIDTFGGASISVLNKGLYSGISTSLSWADRIAYDTSGVPSIEWDSRVFRDSSYNTTVDYQNKELRDSGQTAISWSSRIAYDNGSVPSLSWQGRELINSFGRTVYSYELNLMYAFSGSNHAVIDVGGQILYDIADQSSIRWSDRDMYASNGSTVVANYSSSTGMKLYGSVGTGFSTATFTPSARIHAHSLTGIATYQKTTNSVTGALSTDGFDVGISATGVAEIRQRENLDLQILTNNTLRKTYLAAGGETLAEAYNIAVGTTTGTKIGTATTQKLGFWNATPIVQPANTVAIDTVLVNTGLRATGADANFASTSVRVKHLVGETAAPTIAAGTGAGTTPTVAIAGTDLGGYISVTTGTLPTLSAVVATITFNIAYASAPKAICLTPANSSAASLNGVNMVFIDQAGVTTTTFAITAGTTALTAATAYKWYYQVIQ